MSEDSADLSFEDNELQDGFSEIDDGEEIQNQPGNNHFQHLLKIYDPASKSRRQKKVYKLDLEQAQLIKNEQMNEQTMKEEAESTWNPVIYKNDDSNQSRRIKFEYRENSLYPVKIIKRKKKTQNLDLNDQARVKAHLQQLAKEYHKNLLDEVMEQQRIKQEAGVKDEDELIHLDRSLNRFPIYNPAMREKVYKSIGQFKSFINSQQQEILSQLNDPEVTSVFVASLEEISKPSRTAKEYINFKCKVPNCQAILKCVVTVEECELYTFRNKHNHTITGEMLPEEDHFKPTETIVIDEELHKMFDINKGVRSQTRNIKYMDPEERRLQKNKNPLKPRRDLTEQEDGQPAKRPPRTARKIMSKSKAKGKDGRKSDVQFTNMTEQLEQQGYKVYTYHKEGIDSLFPETFCSTKQEMTRDFLHTPVLRLSFINQAIKLDKKKYPDCSSWSVVLVTAHNSAIKSVVVAAILTLSSIAAALSRIFAIILKIFPEVKYLVMEYRPQTKYFVPELQPSSPFKILLDTDDVYHFLKKQMKDARLSKLLEQMLRPSSIPLENCIQYFRERKQNNMANRYNTLKEHLIIQNNSRSFLEFDHSLKLQRQLIAKIKARLRGGISRYTLKSQLQILMETLFSSNKEAVKDTEMSAASNFQFERAHEDYGLFMVRQSVTSSVMNHFYLQYTRLSFLKPTPTEDGRKLFDDGCEVRNWCCNCPYTKLTGVPCKHLIFVLKQQRKNYLGLFHRKWIINEEHLAEQEIVQNDEQFFWKAIKDVQQRAAKETPPQDRSRSRDRGSGRPKRAELFAKGSSEEKTQKKKDKKVQPIK